MPNNKITDFTALTAANVATDDVIPIVDISETLAANQNKKITAGNLANGLAGVVSVIPTVINNVLALKSPLASPTFTGTVVLPSTTSIGNVSNAEIGYLDGVTSAIQTQLNGKANLTGNVTFSGGTVTAAGFSGPLTGNATTATAWATARSITLSGDISGSVTGVNGTGNITITNTLIGNGAVTGAKIAGTTITAANLANSAIVTDKIATDAVVTDKILNGAVTGAKIAGTTITAANLAANSVVTDKIIDGAVTAPKLNGAQTGSAPIYGIRAFVNFDATTTNSSTSATYNRSGTATVTITATSHGYLVGQVVYLDFTATSGTVPIDGNYVVASVSSDGNSFTVISGATTASTGNVTLKTLAIRAAGNVHSIIPSYIGADPSAGPASGTGTAIDAGLYIMNFSTPMPSTNYTIIGGAMRGAGAFAADDHDFTLNGRARTLSFAFLGVSTTGGTDTDVAHCHVMVIG